MNSSKRPDVLIMDDYVTIVSEEERKRLNYEEDKAYILNEVERFFTPSLRWINSTLNQFSFTGKNVKDYFLVETFDALPENQFLTPRVRLVWVKKDSSQSKPPLLTYDPVNITEL